MKNEDLILELLRELKSDINNRFEQVDKRFDLIDKRLDRIENNQNREQGRLDQVYESRENVKITFGWQWGMVSLFIAVGAAAIVKVLS